MTSAEMNFNVGEASQVFYDEPILRYFFEEVTNERLAARRSKEDHPALRPNRISVTPYSTDGDFAFVLNSCVELADSGKIQVEDDLVVLHLKESGGQPIMMMLDEERNELGQIPPVTMPLFLSLAAIYSIEKAQDAN